MRKITILAFLILACAPMAFGQERSKVEGAVGFSIDSIDTGLRDTGFSNAGNRQAGYGFDTSVTGFLTDKFGIEGNIDGHYRSKTFTVSQATCQALGCPAGTLSIPTHISSYNFMVGPHIRFGTADSKVTPYIHGLLGANHTRVKLDLPGITSTSFRDSQTDFALKLGGGIDIGMSRHAALRLGVDWNPIFEKQDRTIANGGHRTRNDFLFNIGIAFK
jgi:opacity protein-like surface antigen